MAIAGSLNCSTNGFFQYFGDLNLVLRFQVNAQVLSDYRSQAFHLDVKDIGSIIRRLDKIEMQFETCLEDN